MGKCISIVKSNVSKEMQAWGDVAKYAKVQGRVAQKEINANTPWIEIVKKRKGTLVDKIQMINAKLDEEAKMKARALHVWVVAWAEKWIPQEDAKNLSSIDWGNRIFHLLHHRGWEEMHVVLSPKHLLHGYGKKNISDLKNGSQGWQNIY